ncbi:MAG: HEAT repeat domain-containing protein, partial [Gemmatimonadales bacterium]
PSTESVAVEMFPVRPEPPEPPEPQPKPQAFVPGGGGLTVGGGHPTPPRVRDESMTAVVNPLLDALAGAIQRNAWSEAVQTAQTLVRTLATVPEDARRTFGIRFRRHLTRPVLEAFIDQALRVTEERPRASEVLHWCGLDGAELMLETICRFEGVGLRGFLHDALVRLPEAYPLILPLLTSPRWHEVCHAAELLGRLGLPQAIEPLKARLDHPDERVRIAVIEALGQFREREAVEPLRQALTDPAPGPRALAGRALAARKSAALAMPLMAALESEKDPTTWKELLGSLARIDAPETASALARLALERKSLLSRGGHGVPQRLEVVRVLAGMETPAARQALAKIAAEGDEPVRAAAERALRAVGDAAGKE